MTVQIAQLRGINVGGHQPVAMSDLRDLATGLGFNDARSLLRSGNLVFRSDGPLGADLERLLEAEAEKRLGIGADFMIRSAKEWKAVVARNPFRKEAERDPSHLSTSGDVVGMPWLCGLRIPRPDQRYLATTGLRPNCRKRHQGIKDCARH
jgi:uncharacterized protein (DUF1697 family)